MVIAERSDVEVRCIAEQYAPDRDRRWSERQ
jgi:hypothetical protein